MKKHWKCRLALVMGAVAPTPVARRGAANVFGTVNFVQQVGYDVTSTKITPVQDSAVPFDTVVSVNGSGGTITTADDITDDGSVAHLNISAAATTAAPGYTLFEATDNESQTATSFSFSTPVSYTLTENESGTTGVSGFLSLESSSPLSVLYLPPSPGTVDYSGTLLAGVDYDLGQDLEVSNVGFPSQYPSISGSESVFFTFSPIPEPASLAIFAAALPVAFRRRRRPDNVGGDAGGGPISSTGPDLASMPNGGE